MKNILVLGAGQSTPYLISYLLSQAEQHGWFVTVCDRDPQAAQRRVGRHRRGQAIGFDINDSSARATLIEKADVVVNMLTRPYQLLVAIECVNHNASMVTASYQDPQLHNVEADAHRNNLLILNEMGLDPGIDHMSARSLIHRIRRNGGVVTSFKSYGSALPAPEAETNPLRYVITWSPRNVLMAGEDGALYKEDGVIRLLPVHHLFHRTWPVYVDGIGVMEAFPNRNSLSYVSALGLEDAYTIIRATLRYPGWSETWRQIVYLGMTNEALTIPNIKDMTYRQLTEMFLPPGQGGSILEHRLAGFLGISPTGKIMDNLRWLGLLSEEPIGIDVKSVAEVMIHLITERLRMPEGVRDVVILVHELEAMYPEEGNRREAITSTLVEYGESHTLTAIAKTVGLPVAIATKLFMTGKIPLTGCHIPTHPAIFEPVLRELKEHGIHFTEKVSPIASHVENGSQ